MESLQTGSLVCATSGESTHVVQIKVWEKARREVVDLCTQRSAHIVVTASHRVVVPSAEGEVVVEAGTLLKGQEVCCKDGADVLSYVHKRLQEVEVFELTFDPDLAVDAWSPVHSAICTKGRDPATRRRTSQISLITLTRHPDSLEAAIAANETLDSVRVALRGAGSNVDIGGAWLFVQPHQVPGAAAAVVQKSSMGRQHIIVAEEFLEQLKVALAAIPHKDNVRIKSLESLVHLLREPFADRAAGMTLITNRTFLEVKKRSRADDLMSVVNSTTVAHGGKNPRVLEEQ